MRRLNTWVFPFLLAATALIGMLALWHSTPYGLGLVNDSATYVEGATNLLAGKGYVRVSGGGELKPISQFPPLFSILLAGMGALGIPLLQAARALIVVLFGLDILLVGLSINQISRSAGFACLGALLLAVSDVHLGVYSFALSEPLFLTWMLAAFLCLATSFQRPGWVWPVLSGFFLSLAYLTRYAGASLFITAALVILLFRAGGFVRRAGLVLVGALPPVLAWLGSGLGSSSSSSLTNRQLLWHPVPLKVLFEALKNLLTWAAPNDLLAASPWFGRMLSLLSLAALIGLAAWLVWAGWRQNFRKNQTADLASHSKLAFTLGLHILVYLGFLVITLSFFDASTPLNDRILSVVYLPGIILACSGLAWLWVWLKTRSRVLPWLLPVFCLAWTVFSAKDGYATVARLAQEGQGFAHRGISGSPAMQLIRSLPPGIIYSNKPGAIFLLTAKTAYVTPTPLDPVTNQPRQGFAEDLAAMQQRVESGKAILVIFGLRGSSDPAEVDLFAALTDGLSIRADYGNIVVFGASP